MSLVVVRAAGLATVQDLGRPGHMHEAVAPGGALVPELLALANCRAHNPAGAAAIELLGQLVVRAERPLLVATDARAWALAAGQELALESEPRRVAYLAVRGGVDGPALLGSRSAMLSAGFGAPLRAGARIASAGLAEIAPPAAEPFTEADTIHVVPGPDLDAFTADAIDVLTTFTYRVLPASDRIGTRLGGAPLPRAPGHVETSRPMVRGALEVPSDGRPIVLGPEHPTTGGYPVLAVIAHADLGRFHAIRLGGRVHFRV